MIKAKIGIVGPDDIVANPIYLIGLSEQNIAKLKQGQPIAFDATDLGMMIQGRIVIVYGETEDAIVDSLKAHGAIEKQFPTS